MPKLVEVEKSIKIVVVNNSGKEMQMSISFNLYNKKVILKIFNINLANKRRK